MYYQFFQIVAIFSFLIGISRYFVTKAFKHKFWNLPGPDSQPIYGSIFEITNLGESCKQFAEWGKVYGKSYALMFGAHATLVTSDPAIIKDVFITNRKKFRNNILYPALKFGNPFKIDSDQKKNHKYWKEISLLINSRQFAHKSKVKIESALQIFGQLIDEGKNKKINSYRFMYNLSIDVWMKVLLSDETNYQCNVNSVITRQLNKFANNDMRMQRFAMYLHEIRILLDMFVYLKKALFGIESIFNVRNEIENLLKRRTDNKYEDLISMFQNNAIISRYKQCDVILFILFSNVDFMASCLSLVLLLLGVDPGLQNKLDKSDNKVALLKAIILEALRLYPIRNNHQSATSMDWVNLDVFHNNEKIQIPPGCTVQVDIWNLHRDCQIYGEYAHHFKPERWINDMSLRKQHQYCPFGLGDHETPGSKFMLETMIIILNHILLRYRVKMSIDVQLPLDFTGSDVWHVRNNYIHLIAKQQ